MRNRFKLLISALLIFLPASLALADQTFIHSLGLTAPQAAQLKTAQQTKKTTLDPAKIDRDSSTQNLAGQVLANAGDSTVQPVLNQILNDTQTIDSADDSYWQNLTSFLTPTAAAKLYLKDHHPKNQNPSPNPGAPKPHYDWTAYFGLTPTLQAQFKTADEARSASVKPAQENADSYLAQLSQQVQGNAEDSVILGSLSLILSNVQTIHQTEEAFWAATLPGFLSPTQEAKIYLHRHPPKGGFTPPPPAAPVTGN
jgi:hypothetical protein